MLNLSILFHKVFVESEKNDFNFGYCSENTFERRGLPHPWTRQTSIAK